MKQLLVFGKTTFKITVPDDAKITFGPWSPPNRTGQYDNSEKVGTLRIYQGSKENILACFAGVTGFRDLSLGYAEQIAKEEGATIWKDDQNGYTREEKHAVRHEWVDDPVLSAKALPAPRTTRKRK